LTSILEYYARLTKVSSMGVSATGGVREYEEMTPAKWKQTAKDVAIGGLGVGLGFGAGKLITDSITDEMMKNKAGWKLLKKYGPVVGAGASGLAAAGFRYRSAKHKQNRDRAEARHQAKLQQQVARLRARTKGPAKHRIYGE
jgi:hypothetical protein